MNDWSKCSSGSAAAKYAYEVQVEGVLSPAFLKHLGWSCRTEAGQSCVRVSARSSELAEFVRSCFAGGLIVDRVTRIQS